MSSTPVRIESVEAVDPSEGDKVVGTNRVVALGSEDVAGKVKGFVQKTVLVVTT